MSNEYYDQPTILGKIDEGDDDCRLWVITAGYKNQTTEVADRDWMRGERRAIEAVKAKVAALEAPKWIVEGQTKTYGPYATEEEANTIRVYNTSGWGEVKKVYPCPKHPDVLRKHELQCCHKCEAEVDAAIMPTMFDEDRKPAPSHTPETDHDFNEVE